MLSLITLQPCWEADFKAPECDDSDCRECDVYRMVNVCGDIKSLTRKVFTVNNN